MNSNLVKKSAILWFCIYLFLISVATLKIARMPDRSFDGYMYSFMGTRDIQSFKTELAIYSPFVLLALFALRLRYKVAILAAVALSIVARYLAMPIFVVRYLLSPAMVVAIIGSAAVVTARSNLNEQVRSATP